MPNARLSRAEFIIMKLLMMGSEKYGLELVEKSNGAIKRGSVYVTLGRLEDKGFIQSRKEPPAPGIASPRRLYKPTRAGLKVFQNAGPLGVLAFFFLAALAFASAATATPVTLYYSAVIDTANCYSPATDTLVPCATGLGTQAAGSFTYDPAIGIEGPFGLSLTFAPFGFNIQSSGHSVGTENILLDNPPAGGALGPDRFRLGREHLILLGTGGIFSLSFRDQEANAITDGLLPSTVAELALFEVRFFELSVGGGAPSYPECEFGCQLIGSVTALQFSPVSEPDTMLLLLAGILMIFRRKKAARKRLATQK